MRIIFFAFACSVSTSLEAIELTDYQLTETATESLVLDFAGRYDSKNYREEFSSGSNDTTDFDLNINHDWEKATKARVVYFGTHLSGHSHKISQKTLGGSSYKVKEETTRFRLGLNDRRYFSESGDKYFWFGAIGYSHLHNYIDQFQYGSGGVDVLDTRLGFGYGRQWNTTPLMRAIRIDETLRDYQVLSRSQNDDELRALANLIAKEIEYENNFGYYEYISIWIGEMVKLLKSSELLQDRNAEALAGLKIREVLFDEYIYGRLHGAVIQLGAGRVTDFYGKNDSSDKMELNLRYALPVNTKGQFSDSVSVLWQDADYSRTTLISNRLNYSYELGKRLNWYNSWDWGLYIIKPKEYTGFENEKSANLQYTLSSSFSYRISNKTDLILSAQRSKTKESSDDDVSTKNTESILKLGISYRFR